MCTSFRFIASFHIIFGLCFHVLPQQKSESIFRVLWRPSWTFSPHTVAAVLSVSLCDYRDVSYLQFDGDDHRGEVFIQLLQHDQLLQSQVEQPADKHKETWIRRRTSIRGPFIPYRAERPDLANEWTVNKLL